MVVAKTYGDNQNECRKFVCMGFSIQIVTIKTRPEFLSFSLKFLSAESQVAQPVRKTDVKLTTLVHHRICKENEQGWEVDSTRKKKRQYVIPPVKSQFSEFLDLEAIDNEDPEYLEAEEDANNVITIGTNELSLNFLDDLTDVPDTSIVSPLHLVNNNDSEVEIEGYIAELNE
ncbi:hypothetical protein ARMGADRAFT_1034096 [Armillaria gallica]|uniref:Uncharacterized protein n=1 Tax=Armillaria gallica TaxID=47427 RepID=A0A2H3CZK7_ARMGA|nr:hypothetical protein ARMGADRAFT_1034096 [Armillaria gallica]